MGHQHRSWPVVRLKAHFQERLIRALVRPYQPLDRASIQAHRCSSRHDSCCSGAHHTRRAPATRIPRSIACHRCSRQAAEKQLWHLASGQQWHRAHQCCAAARLFKFERTRASFSCAAQVLQPVSTGDQEHGVTRILHVRHHHSRHEDAAQPAKEAWTNASRAHRPGSFRGRLR